MKAGCQKPKVRGHKFLFGVLMTLLSCAGFAQVTNEIPPLMPAYPAIPPTFWEQHGTSLVLTSFTALLLIALVIWLALKPKSVTPEPPETLARRALEVLRQRNEDGVVLSEVSQILRRYLVAVFALAPDELTTSEFCLTLHRNQKVSAELAAAVADFLRRCDERKFSPVATSPLNAAARALELVQLAEARRAHLRQLTVAPPLPIPAPRA